MQSQDICADRSQQLLLEQEKFCEDFRASYIPLSSPSIPSKSLSSSNSPTKRQVRIPSRLCRRRKSLPPNFRLRKPAPPSSLQRLRKTARSGISKTINWCKSYRPSPKALKYIATASATGLFATHLYRNSITWSNNLPPAVTHYNAYPQWMHRENSYAALGIPEPLFPAWVPPFSVADRALRRLAKWHPDRWRKVGFSSREQAEKAWTVFAVALTRFERYWENPYCEESERSLMKPIDEGPTARFASSTNCTAGTALWDATKMAFTLPEKQPIPPSDDEALKEYYPCSFPTIVKDSLARMHPSRIPPGGISRYHEGIDDLDTRHPSILWWRWWNFGLDYFDPPDLWSEEKIEELGQRGKGWLSWNDEEYWRRTCEVMQPHEDTIMQKEEEEEELGKPLWDQREKWDLRGFEQFWGEPGEYWAQFGS